MVRDNVTLRPGVFAHIRAFLNGMREFRSDFTTHYPNWLLVRSYDRGRELAHRLTRRRYD